MKLFAVALLLTDLSKSKRTLVSCWQRSLTPEDAVSKTVKYSSAQGHTWTTVDSSCTEIPIEAQIKPG